MRLVLVFVCLALTSWRAEAQPSSQPSGKTMSMCPAILSGATLSTADTPQGITVDVTVPSAQVDELRTHVQHMADMHEHMTGMHEHEGKMMLPPADLKVEDIDGGSRVTFTAKDPADADALRAKVTAHVAMIRSGKCPKHNADTDGP
jgi:hypothetical protein